MATSHIDTTDMADAVSADEAKQRIVILWDLLKVKRVEHASKACPSVGFPQLTGQVLNTHERDIQSPLCKWPSFFESGRASEGSKSVSSIYFCCCYALTVLNFMFSRRRGCGPQS